LITELAEGGVGDQTIMDIAGHVSRQMLKHYSHIRMQAKRDALESVVKTVSSSAPGVPSPEQLCEPVSDVAQEIEGVSLQKSLQSDQKASVNHRNRKSKSLNVRPET
jgi:hypothetical protein